MYAFNNKLPMLIRFGNDFIDKFLDSKQTKIYLRFINKVLFT